MSPEDIWYGKSLGAATVRGLLLPLTGLYWLGWSGYVRLYRHGIKKSKDPHKPIVCVGNLLVGGTGKSPTVIYIAGMLHSIGHQVVISASGYGSPASESATLAPEGELDAARWGDEPAMIRWLLPEVPLIVGRDRVEAARLCNEHFPGAVMLMDDGLQHLPLRKHLKIALDDSGIRNRWVMPSGPYREPPSNLPRMKLVIETGSGQSEWPFRTVYEPLTFIDPTGIAVDAPKHASVLCALARSDKFLQSLQEAGVQVSRKRLLPDHDDLSEGNLFDGLSEPVVVTAKDWVKLRSRADIAGKNILMALRNARIEPEAKFRSWLEDRLQKLT